MSPFDLTNLPALKAWLGLSPAAGPNDATLTALITAASRSIYSALSRPSLLPQSYTETVDLETRRITLRQWPVLQVTLVTLCGNAVPQDTNADLEGPYGYALQPGDGIRQPGPRRSTCLALTPGLGRICSVIHTGPDGKVSWCPTAPVMQSKTRRRRFLLPTIAAQRIFALRTLGIGSRRHIRLSAHQQ